MSNIQIISIGNEIYCIKLRIEDVRCMVQTIFQNEIVLFPFLWILFTIRLNFELDDFEFRKFN